MCTKNGTKWQMLLERYFLETATLVLHIHHHQRNGFEVVVKVRRKLPCWLFEERSLSKIKWNWTLENTFDPICKSPNQYWRIYPNYSKN
mmetsp:Transcript_19334/g.56184  ORF Transcript_19334/g.56184 Transcript_19334/m.56184 type:complete len:89 (-) Transcript_19334:58-324(-)